MMRGSGIAGLAAMTPTAPVPCVGAGTMRLVRPFLDVPKARLIATLEAEGIGFADDPTNRDAAFTRARLRGLMPRLASEGLDAARLSLLARRLRRADAAIEAAVDDAMAFLHLPQGVSECTLMRFDARPYFRLPAEIGLRLLGRAIDAAGDEGPVELAKLEALKTALDHAHVTGIGLRRTLAGALVTLAKGQITVERAPPRRSTATKWNPGRKSLTKRQSAARMTKNR
jgi:tRNA(Ile)-lysidine synthase